MSRGKRVVQSVVDDFGRIRAFDEDGYEIDREILRNRRYQVDILERAAPPPLPKPTKPDAREQRRTYDSTYQRDNVHSGFTLPSLDAVKAALEIYGGERSRGGIQAQALDGMPDLGAVLFLTHDANQSRSSFLQRLFKEIDAHFAVLDRNFSRDWDYDGAGPWHKTGLTIEKRDEGYHFHLWRAYTGNQCEYALAEQIKAPMDFIASKHCRTWACDGPRFSIPLSFFREVFEIAGLPFDRDQFHEEFVWELNRIARPYDAPEPAVRRALDGINLYVSLISYRGLAAYQHRDLLASGIQAEALEYRIEGDCFAGPARRDNRFPDLFPAIGVEVGFWAAEGHRTNRETRARCIALGDALEAKHPGLPKAYATGDA